MIIHLHDNNYFVLRCETGKDVINELLLFVSEKAITAATFTALGASEEITLSYYDLANKQYLDKTISEDLEIASVIGNIALLNNKPVIHAHGSFGNKQFETFSGHIKKLVVSATCEVHLTVLMGKLTRAYDPTTGLNLLSDD